MTLQSDLPYPHIRVSGNARHRGCAYGAEARHLIHQSLDLYERLFQHYRGWDWRTVTDYAQQFVAPVEALDADYLEEIAGVAEGASVGFADVLAINVRTEIIYGDPSAAWRNVPATNECSSFAALRSRSGGGMLLGQNWDMYVPAGRSVVMLERVRADGHSTVSVVEAGLLAKIGLNTAGLAVGTNTLVAESNAGQAGVPYHVVLRALLDCTTVDEAHERLRAIPFRSSAANYLVADAGGRALDFETAAGGADEIFVVEPSNGLVLHTNHFVSPSFTGVDVTRRISTTTLARLTRLREMVGAGRVDVSFLLGILKDHAGGLNSICCHPDPQMPEVEYVSSLYSIVMDVESRTIWLVPGQPCVTPTYELHYGAGPAIAAAPAAA